MSGSVHGRSVSLNTTLYDQADFFQLDGFTRVMGLAPGDLQVKVFFNNTFQPWTLAAGQAVADGQVTTGRVFFHEIPGAQGFYSVRWRPDAAGYWRMIITYPAGTQMIAQDYDVQALDTSTQPDGLHVSFVRDRC